MLDGATAVSDLGNTDENERLVRRFLEEIMMNGRMDRFTSYFGFSERAPDSMLSDNRPSRMPSHL
jgi:hypothetical protein